MAKLFFEQLKRRSYFVVHVTTTSFSYQRQSVPFGNLMEFIVGYVDEIISLKEEDIKWIIDNMNPTQFKLSSVLSVSNQSPLLDVLYEHETFRRLKTLLIANRNLELALTIDTIRRISVCGLRDGNNFYKSQDQLKREFSIPTKSLGGAYYVILGACKGVNFVDPSYLFLDLPKPLSQFETVITKNRLKLASWEDDFQGDLDSCRYGHNKSDRVFSTKLYTSGRTVIELQECTYRSKVPLRGKKRPSPSS